MRWLPFFILAIATLACQCTVVQMMSVRHVWPDWLFVLAVHYALWGPWPDAAIAAWLLGLLMDVQSGGRIGLHAFCFGAAAWVIVRVRQVVFRDHPVTQALITLALAFAVRLVVGVYDAYRAGGEVDSVWWPIVILTNVWERRSHSLIV